MTEEENKDVLEFTLVRREIPVNFKDESGTPKQYRLREMNGAQRDTYFNSMGARMRYTAEGKPAGIREYTGLHSDLIHLTLVDEDGKQVPKAEIQSWPSHVVKGLFDKARELNGLEDDQQQAEDATKNG